MKNKLSKFTLLIGLALGSVNVFAEDASGIDGYLEAANSNAQASTVTKLTPTGINGGFIVNFPVGVLAKSNPKNASWAFSSTAYSNLQSVSGARTIYNRLLPYKPFFDISARTFGLDDPLLLMAFAATESGGFPNAVGPAVCNNGSATTRKYNLHIGRNSASCGGLMQLSMAAITDIYLHNSNRGVIQRLDDRFEPSKAIHAAGIYLGSILPRYLNSAFKNKNVKDPYGFPANSIVNRVRSYNSGAGTLASGMANPKSAVNKENVQYAYKTALYYYAFGGKKGFFTDLLQGRDSYLKAKGINVGTGDFDFAKAEYGSEVTPYSIPKRECTLGSPLQYSGKLPVSNPFGDRFDYDKNQPRKNITVDFGVPVGTQIIAMGEGTVLGTKQDTNQGLVLLLKLSNGSVVSYGGLQNIGVSSGQAVMKGQVLGTTGDQNAYKTPLLLLGYFKDASGDLSFTEQNANIEDPLSVFCEDVDVPVDMTINAGALPEMVTDVKIEQANSLSGAIEQMIKNRLGNKQWLSDIASMSESRLYAEYAYQQMIATAISQRNSTIKEKVNSYQATYLSLMKEKTFEDETESRRQATINK